MSLSSAESPSFFNLRISSGLLYGLRASRWVNLSLSGLSWTGPPLPLLDTQVAFFPLDTPSPFWMFLRMDWGDWCLGFVRLANAGAGARTVTFLPAGKQEIWDEETSFSEWSEIIFKRMLPKDWGKYTRLWSNTTWKHLLIRFKSTQHHAVEEWLVFLTYWKKKNPTKHLFDYRWSSCVCTSFSRCSPVFSHSRTSLYFVKNVLGNLYVQKWRVFPYSTCVCFIKQLKELQLIMFVLFPRSCVKQ